MLNNKRQSPCTVLLNDRPWRLGDIGEKNGHQIHRWNFREAQVLR